MGGKSTFPQIIISQCTTDHSQPLLAYSFSNDYLVTGNFVNVFSKVVWVFLFVCLFETDLFSDLYSKIHLKLLVTKCNS